jgi:hypothetical protein
MRRKSFRKTITWLLIASPLWWIGGCYTMTNIDISAASRNQDIEVTTKSQSTYTFHEWKIDSLRTLQGTAAWKNPRYTWLSISETKYLRGRRAVPLDSIVTIRSSELSVPGGILLGIGAVVVSAIVVAMITRPFI